MEGDYRDQVDIGHLSKQLAQTEAGGIRTATLRENVAHDLKRARANVERLEELGKLLDANPSTSRILELLGRG